MTTQRFLTGDDNTVTDSKTNLVWSKATLATDVDYAAAEKAVEALGKGWRLPTIDELLTLVDRSTHSPAINTEAFPETECDWYWTGTPCAWNDKARWVVYFDDGGVDYARQGYSACVRAVRETNHI